MLRRFAVPAALACALLAVVSAAPSASSARLHVTLVRSFPAKDTVLAESPAEVRLWFSGETRPGTTTLQVLDADAKPVTVHMDAPAVDPQDAKVQFAKLHGPLANGRYRVSWATVAADGESAKGEIAFSVRTR